MSKLYIEIRLYLLSILEKVVRGLMHLADKYIKALYGDDWIGWDVAKNKSVFICKCKKTNKPCFYCGRQYIGKYSNKKLNIEAK